MYPVALADLARARGSTYQPFPPQHAWFTFDFSRRRLPEPGEVRQAICSSKPDGRAANHHLGIKGIRKAARRIGEWPKVMDEKMLRDACINTCIMIDARGGTGGGCSGICTAVPQ